MAAIFWTARDLLVVMLLLRENFDGVLGASFKFHFALYTFTNTSLRWAKESVRLICLSFFVWLSASFFFFFGQHLRETLASYSFISKKSSWAGMPYFYLWIILHCFPLFWVYHTRIILWFFHILNINILFRFGMLFGSSLCLIYTMKEHLAKAWIFVLLVTVNVKFSSSYQILINPIS